MKRFLTSLIFILIISSVGFSQGPPVLSRTFAFNSTGILPTAPGLNILNLNVGFLKVQWDISGSGPAALSSCTFSIDGSTDGVNWPTSHIMVSNCISDGQTVPFQILTSTSFIRINILNFTASFGTPILAVNLSFWNEITGATSINPLYTNSIVGGTDGTKTHTFQTDSIGNLYTKPVIGLPLRPCNPLVRANCNPPLAFQ